MRWADIVEGNVIHHREKNSYLVLESYYGIFKLLCLDSGAVLDYSKNPRLFIDPMFWRVEDR